MKRLKKSDLFAILLIVILFPVLIYLKSFSRIFLSIFLSIYAIIICNVIKKNKIISIKSNQVLLLVLAIAVINLTTFYLLGLYFGYTGSNIKFSAWAIFNYIIPITIIIVSSEIIRYRITLEDNNFSKTLIVIAMILIDMILYTQTYNITVLKDFLAIMGFVIFDSIATNLLYEYITLRYGSKPIITYRVITGLYMYIIPFVPNVQIFLRTIIRMIIPYLMYLLLEFVFEKKQKIKDKKAKRNNYVAIGVILTGIILLAMLISCRFYYGILVVGSESMTGAINKGDATIFVKYKNQKIKDGDVVIFKKDDLRIIHRVIGTTKVGNNYRYYTKGDSNAVMDSDYIEDKDIIGIGKLRIPYIGYPTIWLREAFEKK